jgi:hypothetical protein
VREFPQPQDFPPPSIVSYSVVTAIVVAVLAVILFHPARRARFYDALCWVAAGFVLSGIFQAGNDGDFRIESALERGVAIVWTLMAPGVLIAWARLVRQKDDRHLVLSILAVVLALTLVPNYQRPRINSRRGQCVNNMHQLGIALYNYRDVQGAWPLHADGDPPHSWRVDLLPYLDHGPQQKQYDFTATWDAEVNRPLTNREMYIYHCPSHEGYKEGQPFPTSYALLIGDNAAWTKAGLIDPVDIPDGASNTAILTEACGLNIIWTEPRDIDLATAPIGINLRGDAPGHSPSVVSSYHPLGPPVLMADGSVRNLTLDTDPNVLKAMLTADGGEDNDF